MAYVTVDQIKSMFRRIKIEADTGDESTNTVVTTEEVDEFIAETEAVLNAKLSEYYETPITGTESLLIVRKIVRMKVAHIIKGILEVTDAESDKKQDVQGNLDKQADKLIEKLLPQCDPCKKEFQPPILPLPDAVTKDFSPRNGSLFSSHTSKAVPTPKPTVTKGGNNW